jgi:hypothetical protein
VNIGEGTSYALLTTCRQALEVTLIINQYGALPHPPPVGAHIAQAGHTIEYTGRDASACMYAQSYTHTCEMHTRREQHTQQRDTQRQAVRMHEG